MYKRQEYCCALKLPSGVGHTCQTSHLRTYLTCSHFGLKPFVLLQSFRPLCLVHPQPVHGGVVNNPDLRTVQDFNPGCELYEMKIVNLQTSVINSLVTMGLSLDYDRLLIIPLLVGQRLLTTSA